MPATDNFATHRPGLESPMTRGEAVTPSDTDDGTADFTNVSRALWVGGTGNLVVILDDDTELTFNSVPAGEWLNVRAKRVKATGTTATNIVALD